MANKFPTETYRVSDALPGEAWVSEGTAQALAANDEVRAAYLG